MRARSVSTFTLVVLLLAAASIANAQEPLVSSPARPPVSRLFLRSGLLNLGLAAASTGAAVGLLTTQPGDSWASGVGLASALMAASYSVDATTRLIVAGRIRRAGGVYHNSSSSNWACWFNVFSTAGVMTAGTLVAALAGDQYTQGFGATLAVHGAWLFVWSVTRLVHMRRQRWPWMVFTPVGARF